MKWSSVIWLIATVWDYWPMMKMLVTNMKNNQQTAVHLVCYMPATEVIFNHRIINELEKRSAVYKQRSDVLHHHLLVTRLSKWTRTPSGTVRRKYFPTTGLALQPGPRYTEK